MEFIFKYITHNQNNNAFTDGTKISQNVLRLFIFSEHCKIEITSLACLNIAILMHLVQLTSLTIKRKLAIYFWEKLIFMV